MKDWKSGHRFIDAYINPAVIELFSPQSLSASTANRHKVNGFPCIVYLTPVSWLSGPPGTACPECRQIILSRGSGNHRRNAACVSLDVWGFSIGVKWNISCR